MPYRLLKILQTNYILPQRTHLQVIPATDIFNLKFEPLYRKESLPQHRKQWINQLISNELQLKKSPAFSHVIIINEG